SSPTTPRAWVGRAGETASAAAPCLLGVRRRVPARPPRRSAPRVLPGRGVNRDLCTLQVVELARIEAIPEAGVAQGLKWGAGFAVALPRQPASRRLSGPA